MDKIPLLQLKNLKKTYKTGPVYIKAMDNFSLELKENDFLAVMGPSGSGKSTLLNIIGTLDYSYSGEYRLKGELISKKSGRELAKIRRDFIGFIFQEFSLLPRYTALKNVALPLTYKGIEGRKKYEIALEALKRLGLENRKNHKPSELSGGEQQRVAIARSLVNHPKILLADEPTGNVDTKTGKMIMETLKRLDEDGLTIIMVTHDIEMANYANRLIKLKDGRLEEESAAT